MTWGAVATIGGAVLGAGASIYGSNKAAGAEKDAARAGAAFQNRALDTQLALSRPQLEVGNSALGVLAQLFGLDAPSKLDFDGLGSGASATQNGLATDRPATGAELNQLYRDILGREADPGGLQYYLQNGFSPADFANATRGSAEYRQKFEAGTLPRSETDPNFQQEQQQAAQQQPGQSVDFDSLVSNNPLIRFQRQQGEQSINRNLAARGLNQSGGGLKDLTQFNSDLTGAGIQQFVLNPLFQLAGFGPQAAAQAGGAVSSTSNNLSNLALQSGQARSSAFQNQGNILGNLATDIGGAFANRNTRINNPRTPVGSNPSGGTYYGDTANLLLRP